MACIVMAYIVMACIVMAYLVMAYIVMAYIVMAYQVLFSNEQGTGTVCMEILKDKWSPAMNIERLFFKKK